MRFYIISVINQHTNMIYNNLKLLLKYSSCIIFYVILKYVGFLFKKKNKENTINKEELFFFINDHNYSEITFLDILEKTHKINLVYKSKPKYLDQIRRRNKNYKIIITKYIYWKFFINPNLKFLIVNNSHLALPYIIMNKNFIIYIYDTSNSYKHFSLNKIVEKYVLNSCNNIIHRDLRINKSYKKIIKKKNNLLFTDNLKNKFLNRKKSYIDKKIHAVSIGFIDNGICSIEKTLLMLCGEGIITHIYTSKDCLNYSQVYLKDLKNKYPNNIIIEKYLPKELLLKEISKFDIGICPHEKSLEYSKIGYNEDYYSYCSSNRVVDYLNANLSILISKKYLFQKYMIRRFNSKVIYYEDCMNNSHLKVIEKYKKLQNYQHSENSCKIFRNEYKAKKLMNFLTNIYEKNK